MAKKEKQPKPRAEKYDEKLAVNGTLEGMLKAAAQPLKKPKK